MKIRIKKMHPEAEAPAYSHPTDACFDLKAVSFRIDEYGNYVYGTGLAFEVPEGYYLQLQPRSSVTARNLVMLNSPGIVDSGFRGEVLLKFRPIISNMAATRPYEVGDRVAQGVILPCPKAEFQMCESLSDSDRGSRGYGSTGV